ncbi:thioesterase domain-containing protein [Streptomyces parvulus]|uniref:thioesterase domain-containing protein n=1 Tax=Streptomyces parvulus TaxID=146923 RepID=UPI0033C45829
MQPAGQYHPLGWSAGGTTAHALACRLRRDGDQVRFLALLDSGPAVAGWTVSRGAGHPGGRGPAHAPAAARDPAGGVPQGLRRPDRRPRRRTGRRLLARPRRRGDQRVPEPPHDDEASPPSGSRRCGRRRPGCRTAGGRRGRRTAGRAVSTSSSGPGPRCGG